MEIRFKKLVPEAKLPTQGKPGDAAFDLYCVGDITLRPGQTVAVSTGLQLADMPDNHEGVQSSFRLKVVPVLPSREFSLLGGSLMPLTEERSR